MYTRLSHEPSVTHAHTSASAAGSSNVTGSSGEGGSTLTCLNMIVDNIPPQQHGATSVGDDLSPRPQQHLQHQQQNNSSPNSHCSMWCAAKSAGQMLSCGAVEKTRIIPYKYRCVFHMFEDWLYQCQTELMEHRKHYYLSLITLQTNQNAFYWHLKQDIVVISNFGTTLLSCK